MEYMETMLNSWHGVSFPNLVKLIQLCLSMCNSQPTSNYRFVNFLFFSFIIVCCFPRFFRKTKGLLCFNMILVVFLVGWIPTFSR